MSASGAAFWIGGFTDTPGGGTQGYIFHRNATPSNPAATESVFRSGDLISGLPITGIGANYDVSDDGNHLINQMALGTDAGTDTHIIIDGAVVAAREGSLVFPGAAENWENFRHVGINNAGNYVLSGDTSARPDMDGFLAYNGALIARESGALDGRTLNDQPLAVSINNSNRIAFIWHTSLGTTIFYGDAADTDSIRALFTVGEMIDTDGDGVGDFFLTDFSDSPFGLDLADTGLIYVNVNIAPPGGAPVEAIIGFPRCRTDCNVDGTVNSGDISSFLAVWVRSVQNPDLAADFNHDLTVNSGDLSAFLTQWIADLTGGC